MSDRVSDFLGGSPLGVLVRLVVISLLVGVLLSWLGWTPREILFWIEGSFRDVWRTLFGSLDSVVNYFLLGAAIVFPLFLLSRLLKSGRR
ncbi:DUF6460 domain-containing protein [Aureimonas leprariae]|uniref:DUF6460 domain-containing protein n=1 Tax=Plantimonas leprariae TaxID=2615207 RepID=A0A7V7TWU4_9HYPH|nr:DUF6460 domain-containing protein [Aureimonas leprariae]KAB0680190.1 hypothetical protein F6X38_08355 [Aureimonas leprariae]